MLDEIRQSYEKNADIKVPGWRVLNKNQLLNKCIEFEHDPYIRDGYMSAAMTKYWGSLTKFYYQNSSSISKEDCYEWLVDAIIWALKDRKWTDPTNKLYTDPNGPDKVVNRNLLCSKLGFYQHSNCIKRKVNYQTCSADRLQEELGDAAFPAEEDEDITSVIDVSDDLIMKAFNKQDYFSCALIDNIAHKETYDVTKESGIVYTQFNPRKLAKELRKCDEEYCKKFSRRYKVDVTDMQEVVTKIKNFSSEKIYRWIERSIRKLRESKDIQEMIG